MPLLKPPRGIQLNTSHPLARGLVGAWVMNEGGGNKIFDASRRNNSGTLSGVDWAAGIHGCALKSDAATDYTDLGNIGVLDGATEATVIAKVMFSSVSVDSDIFVIGTHSISQPLVFFFDEAITDHFGLLITDNNNDSTGWKYSSLVPAIDTWYHLAVVFTGGVNTRLYIDSKEDTGNHFPLSHPNVNDIKSNDTYTIGADDAHTSKGARALIDHVLLYRRALTAAEIGRLYREPYAMFAPARGGELCLTLPAGTWLAGSAQGQSATSATLKQGHYLISSAAAQSQGTGTLSRGLIVAGSASSAASVAGVLKAVRRIAASVGALSGASGTISVTEGLLLVGTAGGTSASYSILTVSISAGWFAASLEIERWWLREALFNGLSSNAVKLGTGLTSGWFWIRVIGCTALYRGAGMEQMDFANILVVAAPDAGEIQPPDYLSHDNNSTYFYVIRRFNHCGYQECTLGAAVKISINGNGEPAKPQPNKIFGSKVKQVDGNRIHLIWFYCPLEQKSKPACFRIYWDELTGQIDYENPIATASYQGRRYYNYRTEPIDAGEHLFAIRAEDAAGVENNSLAKLKAELHTSSPASISLLSAEAI